MRSFSYKIMILFTYFFSFQQITAQWKNSSGVMEGNYLGIAINSSNDNIFVSARNGVFVSADSGNTWTKTSLSHPIRSFYAKGDTIFAAADSSVWRSTDNGKTWLTKNDGLPVAERYAITGNNSRLFVATGMLYYSTNNGDNWVTSTLTTQGIYSLSCDGSDLLAAGNGLLYLSTNNGTSWSLLIDSLKSSPFTFAIKNKRILVGTDKGLYNSTDYGQSWNSDFSMGRVDQIIFSDTDIYTRGNGIHKSTDGGNTWKLINGGSYEEIIASNNNVFLRSYPPNIYRSLDGGLNWEIISSSFFSQYIYSMMTQGKSIFISTDIGGIYRSTNNGITWIKVFGEPNGYGIFSLASDGKSIYAGSGAITGGKFMQPDGAIYQSIDNGKNWTKLNITLKFITTLYADSLGLYAGALNNGLYFSSDEGNNFNNIGFSNQTVTSISANSSTLYAGTDSGLYSSTDNGITWTQSNNTTSITSLLVDENNIFTGIYSGGLNQSTDGGLTWTQRLLQTTVRSLGKYDNKLFAGCDGGDIYISTDNGANWNNFNNGLPVREISCLGFIDTTIFVGMDEEVWSRSLPSIVVSVNASQDASPHTFTLSQNYPNPFNPTTTIDYSIPKESFVTIKVYDALGREIKTLVNEIKIAGNYNVLFNGSNLASGIYFYKMQAGDFVQTKKLVLLK